MLLQTIVLISVCSGVYSQNHGFNYPPNCAPPNMTTVSPNLPAGTQAPPFPFIPNTFQTRVEANIVDKGYSIVAEEYYDFPNNRAALRLLQNNTQKYIVFDYSNDQILNVIDGGCFATDLQNDNNNLLFGMKSGLKGMPHIYSTPNALHFAQRNGLQYMGRSTVRGIPADRWQSCMTWPLLNSNFTLDYYFTAYNSSYVEPDLSLQVPLRAVVSGVQVNNMNGPKQFTHVYEYFDFRNRIWGDDSVFETPRGMVCEDRKQTRPVPTLGARFSFREEIIRNDGNEVSQVGIWYDHKDKRVRFDYRPSYLAYPYYTTNLVTEVHDYTTGIAYAIDRDNGNCTTFPIENTTFDASHNVTSSDGADQFYLQMKTPNQLFFIDNTSTYEGVRNCRGMLCDVFISTSTDFSLPFFGQFSTTFELYFLNKEWLETNHGQTSIPIQLTLTTPDWVGFSPTYNIYDFNQDLQDSAFDVTSCYDDDKKQSFFIKFEGAYDPLTVSQYRTTFIDAFREKMQTQGHFTPLRIQNVKLRIEPSSLYVIGTLLDLPPAISYYKMLPGKNIIHNNGITIQVTSASDCANKCNDPTVLSPCNGFDFCPSTSSCILSKTHVDDGQLASSSDECNHYSRTLQRVSSDNHLIIGWTAIKNHVFVGNFQIHVAGTKYTATAIDSNVALNGNQQLSSEALFSQFDVQVNKDIPGYDEMIITGLAVDDCAQACVDRKDLDCNAFTYCFETGYCTLSKLRPDAEPKAIVNHRLCNLYSRK